MIKYKLDSYILEIDKINKKICKSDNMYHIYLQYNGGYSQTDFIINLDSIHPGLYNTFTTRQLNLLIKKLKTIK